MGEGGGHLQWGSVSWEGDDETVRAKEGGERKQERQLDGGRGGRKAEWELVADVIGGGEFLHIISSAIFRFASCVPFFDI